MADDLDTYDPVRGRARERIDAEELSDPTERALVMLDRRRRRPRYEDGRFLTARDLTRGQHYTLLRQADLAQLSGHGVVHGLRVETNRRGTRLHIHRGMGVARSGESIRLRERTAIRVDQIRVVAGRDPIGPLVAEDALHVARTGSFVLVANPVEYTRAPKATFAEGTVSDIELEDAEIVEGTWFSLVPLPRPERGAQAGDSRPRVAREVFIGGFDPTTLTDGLALAVVGITGGRVQWIDEELVARRVGADAALGFGLAPGKRRLAFQRQYAAHLSEALERRRTSGLGDAIPATEAFWALPPVGPLPRGAVQVTPTEVQQTFFPREIYVEMAIVPEDEVPALLAEALPRAPIDLRGDPQALEGVPVLIVIPVPRAGFDERTPRMDGVYHSPALTGTGRHLVNARPIDALTVLRIKNEPASIGDPLPLDLEAWREAVETAPQLWYVRRPQFATTSVVVPRQEPGDNDVEPIEIIVPPARERIEEALERFRFNNLFGIVDAPVIGEIGELLASDFFEADPPPDDDFSPATEATVYISGIMGELAYAARRPRPTIPVSDPNLVPRSPVFAPRAAEDRLRLRQLDLSDVERVAARFSAPQVRESLRGDQLRSPVLRSVLATSAVVPELAMWATTPDGINSGGPDFIASLAAQADVEGLRTLAATVTMPAKESAPVPDPPEPDIPVEDAESFATIESLGEVASLRAIWAPSHPALRKRLDETLAELVPDPVIVTPLLMSLLAVGFELPTKTNDQVRALLTALQKLRRNRPFVAPNGSEGELLARREAPEPRAALEATLAVPKTAIERASERLAEAGFATGRRTRATVTAHRLLALASPKLQHVNAIAKAADGPFESFARDAQEAVDQVSVTLMRKALKSLALRGPG